MFRVGDVYIAVGTLDKRIAELMGHKASAFTEKLNGSKLRRI